MEGGSSVQRVFLRNSDRDAPRTQRIKLCFQDDERSLFRINMLLNQADQDRHWRCFARISGNWHAFLDVSVERNRSITAFDNVARFHNHPFLERSECDLILALSRMNWGLFGRVLSQN